MPGILSKKFAVNGTFLRENAIKIVVPHSKKMPS